jgi:hypothetical protein
MNTYSMFSTHWNVIDDIVKGGCILLEASSVEDAKGEAEVYADQLTARGGKHVSILVMGSDPDGRPVHKIGDWTSRALV